MNVILLTHGGAEPLLARLLPVAGVTVAGIFVETEVARPRSRLERLRRSIRYDGLAATLAKLGRRSLGGRAAGGGGEAAGAGWEAQAARHGVPLHRVRRFADPASLERMRAAAPDLAIAWGTNILPPAVFELPRLGTLNVHQGLTPYYRGGPSVFWELFNGEPQVGLTVHVVAAAVDAGDVVLQETVPLAYDYAVYGTRFEEFLRVVRAGLRERGADLMVEAVRRTAAGTAVRRPQDRTIGRRYRLPTHAEQEALRRRLRARHAPGARSSPLHDARVESP